MWYRIDFTVMPADTALSVVSATYDCAEEAMQDYQKLASVSWTDDVRLWRFRERPSQSVWELLDPEDLDNE